MQLVWILGPVALLVATAVALLALFFMDFIPKPTTEHRLKANECME